MSNLNLTSLESAVASLVRSIDTYEKLKEISVLTTEDLETVKAGVIQNFEVAYEVCWKFMKRWIEINISPDIADSLTKKELFRITAESKLIDDVEVWFHFNKARNLTSHTYDHNNSTVVFEVALNFEKVAVDFLSRIKLKNT